MLYQAKEIQDIYNKSYLDCQLFMSNFIQNPDGKMPKVKSLKRNLIANTFFYDLHLRDNLQLQDSLGCVLIVELDQQIIHSCYQQCGLGTFRNVLCCLYSIQYRLNVLFVRLVLVRQDKADREKGKAWVCVLSKRPPL